MAARSRRHASHGRVIWELFCKTSFSRLSFLRLRIPCERGSKYSRADRRGCALGSCCSSAKNKSVRIVSDQNVSHVFHGNAISKPGYFHREMLTLALTRLTFCWQPMWLFRSGCCDDRQRKGLLGIQFFACIVVQRVMYTVPLRDRNRDTTFPRGFKPSHASFRGAVPQLHVLGISHLDISAIADLKSDVLCAFIFSPPSSHAQIDPNSVAKMTFMNGQPRP